MHKKPPKVMHNAIFEQLYITKKNTMRITNLIVRS